EIRLTGGLSRSPSWCQTIADIFQAETVPVSGEGAALGAAIHGAWVWHREADEGVSGGGRGATGECKERTLARIAEPFVVLEEERRARPNPERKAAAEVLRRLYRALSLRARGLEGEDPFQLRQELLALDP
ncbi:MAG: hypothetical protein KAJ42_18685, partial [Gemmatimonadetes bacterium]|nr:hypothetical protein [Gemmatimonadota bacterium]